MCLAPSIHVGKRVVKGLATYWKNLAARHTCFTLDWPPGTLRLWVFARDIDEVKANCRADSVLPPVMPSMMLANRLDF